MRPASMPNRHTDVDSIHLFFGLKFAHEAPSLNSGTQTCLQRSFSHPSLHFLSAPPPHKRTSSIGSTPVRTAAAATAASMTCCANWRVGRQAVIQSCYRPLVLIARPKPRRFATTSSSHQSFLAGGLLPCGSVGAARHSTKSTRALAIFAAQAVQLSKSFRHRVIGLRTTPVIRRCFAGTEI